MWGYSINVDRKINSNLMWRTEGRLLRNRKPYFQQENRLMLSKQFLTTVLLIDFKK